LDVDCVLFSTYSDDPIFDVMARGYAAANGYWVNVAVPAPCSQVMTSEIIGSNGMHLAQARKACLTYCAWPWTAQIQPGRRLEQGPPVAAARRDRHAVHAAPHNRTP
jgi:hypothetical protein